jgi:hypothetical protein
MAASLLADPNFGTNLLAIAGVIGSVAAAVISVATFLRQGRQAELSKVNSQKLDLHTEQLIEVKEATNGMTTQLAIANKAQGDAEGHERGLQEGRDGQ